MAKSPRRPAIPNKRSAPAVLPALTLQQALDRTERFPQDPYGWRELIRSYSTTDPAKARVAGQKLAEILPDDHMTWMLLGQIEVLADNYLEAHKHFEHALKLKSDDFDLQLRMSDVLLRLNRPELALKQVDIALELFPGNLSCLGLKSNALARTNRFDEAADLIQNVLIPRDATSLRSGYWNNLGTLKRDTAALQESEKAYLKSASLALADKNTDVYIQALSNRLTLLHYMPDKSAEDILQACKEWGALFPTDPATERPRPADLNPRRKIRIGMYSEGFRQHPVGAMITPALEHLRKFGIELYLYSSTYTIDPITRRLIAAADQWSVITRISDAQFAQRIRDDGIDIMMDLAGHNSGTRMLAMTMQPAPLLVKWVGGLINTTGVEAIDYLITDRVESPLGSDAFYTEKLIRMPDDYICYLPPGHMPDAASLPAQKNGYITLGCFNNATKINDIVLEKWAGLMQAIPNSRLFLKSAAYDSVGLRQHVLDFMQRHGIAAERLRLEGQSNHFELLRRYNDVDVALDPWPYSGGLTTCEALLMGVPVVTLTGPTFAGRHSATHLANVGLPELVAEDWNQYRACVLALASDLDNLASLRTSLRKTLLESPVCDGYRYAQHLATAMRAIWQRYCEGKPRAAMVFTPEGTPWFEDGDAPMEVVAPDLPAPAEDEFQFQFRGKIVTLDHGGAFVGTIVSRSLSRQGTLITIVVDPASNLQNQQEFQQTNSLPHNLIQHYRHQTALGDGESATLYTCQDSMLSGTLEPLAASKQSPLTRQQSTILAKQSIPTSRLDAIDGLQQVDWLILDNSNDNKKILQGAQGRLDSVLLVQIQVLFMDVFKKQPDLNSLGKLLAKHGFQLLYLKQARHISYLPQNTPLAKLLIGSQLLGADAIFVPSDERLEALDDNQRLKLAFILHSAYQAPDAAFHVLKHIDEATANRYLKASGWLGKSQPQAANSPALLLGKNVPRRACVGVPIYNEEKYIEQTIRSLKEQDADNAGFLISDNASTDRTMEIVRDMVGNDARFEIIQHPENQGAFKNFKYAFDRANTEYFMWLGGHDYLSSDYLSRAIRILDDRLDTSMVFGTPMGILADSVGNLPDGIYDFSSSDPMDRYVKSVALLANCVIVHSLFRKAALDDCDWREVISCDHVLISHLLWKGKLAYITDGPRYYRRYFQTRNDTSAERITGQKDAVLPREDFYQYYEDDIAALGKKAIKPNELKKIQSHIKEILQKRFG